MGCSFFGSRGPILSLPVDEMCGELLVIPSHHTSPSSVKATLVKMVFLVDRQHGIGIGFHRSPRGHSKKTSFWIDRIKPPVCAKFHPGNIIANCLNFPPGRVGVIMARFVFPQALGKAAAMYFFSPCGLVIPKISICSASHPSSRAMTEAIRKAKHFLPKRAFPP